MRSRNSIEGCDRKENDQKEREKNAGGTQQGRRRDARGTQEGRSGASIVVERSLGGATKEAIAHDGAVMN